MTWQSRFARNDVLEVVNNGKVIIDYPDDIPYPGCLMLGLVNDNPIHVVIASDWENRIGIVITAYIPDSKLWTEDLRSRRNKR